MRNTTCCFLGHRSVENSEEIREKLFIVIERLITEENVDRFLFGSKSEFDNICYSVVSEIKEKHPHKVTGAEHITVCFYAFLPLFLCSFLVGASLPANSHIAS